MFGLVHGPPVNFVNFNNMRIYLDFQVTLKYSTSFLSKTQEVPGNRISQCGEFNAAYSQA